MSGSIQPAQTGAATISSGAAGVFPVTYGYYPEEGSRAISAIYPWSATTGYFEDLSQLQARGVETTVQSAFVDNSTCGQPVTLQVSGTNQIVIIRANAQGMVPLFFTGAGSLQVSVPAVDAGLTRIQYMNTPLISGAEWSAIATASSSGAPGYAQGSTTPGQMGPLMQAEALGTAPNYTNGTTNPLTTTTSGGALRTAIVSSTGALMDNLPQNNITSTRALQICGAIAVTPVAGTAAQGAALQMDTYGSVRVLPESEAPTYSVAFQVTPAVTATDVATLFGSGTKTIRIHSVQVSLDSSAGTQDVKVSLVKRSAANTGGTSTNPSIVPHDSNSAAATAVVAAYTANPTGLGAAVGTFDSIVVGAPPNSGNPYVPFLYGPSVGDQSIVLRGVAQGIAVNLEGAALATGETIRVKFKWTEV